MHKLMGIYSWSPGSHLGCFPSEAFYKASNYIAYMLQELNIKFVKEDDKESLDWLNMLREKEKELKGPILQVENTAFALALLALEFVKQADVKIHKDGSWRGWFKVLVEAYLRDETVEEVV